MLSLYGRFPDELFPESLPRKSFPALNFWHMYTSVHYNLTACGFVTMRCAMVLQLFICVVIHTRWAKNRNVFSKCVTLVYVDI